MDEIKIREDGVYLNGKKINCLSKYDIKNKAEDSCSEVELKLFAKLV